MVRVVVRRVMLGGRVVVRRVMLGGCVVVVAVPVVVRASPESVQEENEEIESLMVGIVAFHLYYLGQCYSFLR